MTTLSKNSAVYKIPREYLLLIISLVIITTVFGVASSFGVFFKPMLDEFGWTRAATSGPYSLSMILYGLGGIVSGRISDRFRFGTILVITLGGIFLGSGSILMSKTNDIGHLYLFYGVLVGLGQGCVLAPLSSLISRCFTKRRALANGIMASGFGLGPAIVPLIATQIMEALDWRTSLIIMGSVALVTIILLAQFLKAQPDNRGLSNSDSNAQGTINHNKEFSLKEVFSTRQFWMFFVAWLFYGFYIQVAMVHIVPYAIGMGMSAIEAATLFTVIGAIGMIGRLSIGFFGDKSKKESIVVIGLLSIAVVYFGISVSGTPWMLYLFAVVFGSFSGLGLLLSPMLAERFGLTGLGTIFGAIVFAFSLGGAAGPVVAGYMFDRIGTYDAAFILCGIFGITAGLIIWLLKQRH